MVETARSLRTLYFTRAAFSIVWVILVAALAKTNATIATILFILYPAWDALATFFDIRANPPTANKTPQYVNIAISSTTTVAVSIALQKGLPEALIVFGAWALLTGLIQLILGLRRRKQLGAQWPMILSGGQSMLAGVSFIVMAHAPNQGITTLAGYAAFGAFYFLLSAFRLTRTIKAVPVFV
ncbi:membrane protein [Spirosoma jeollabukense]